ncbi:MAG: ParB/RepB/Spo0J family partition protein [Lachnospiraceae bacterium]|jgi:ParB family chromosome partitioning protein|nr:ParB/RepB/Spo0J family partition protein [Lachnospiraceae bacterium]MBQ6320553.1 ParB/RepB/Spo0J family partition protein [Lachnospiraceae bacterium]
MAVKKGLGKGLDTLIPKGVVVSDKPSSAENVKAAKPDQYVKITKVEPNRNQPRKKFDEDALQELSDSIKIHGVLFPILVVDRKDYYEIVAGERRWRAAKMAGLKEVPVIIRDYTEKEIAEISLIENIQRTDLNPIEEAMAYKSLIEEYNLKQDELAERISKSRTAITNSMRLLKLADNVQDMVVEDLISAGHARALLAIDNPDEQYELAQRVMDEKLSVRDIEKIVKAKNKPKIEKKKNEKQEALYHDIEEKLKANIGTKVTIVAKGDKMGKIEIDFYNQDDLQKIMDLLLG